MRRLIITAALAAAAIASPAYAMTYFLTGEWYNSMGQHMCQYGNGTVLNVGINICPMSIVG